MQRALTFIGTTDQLIIAIDGPAGAGKSTTARGVARKLGFVYLETGAMYRAVTLAFVRSEMPIAEEAAEELLQGTTIDLVPASSENRVFLNGEDVSGELRRADVDTMVSAVSRLRSVRERMVGLQQTIGRRLARQHGGLVAEGRDIGTVVFPEAEVKIFMVAAVEERARRRLKELRESDPELTLQAVIDSLEKRDRRDAERSVGPLRRADDAIELDTTGLSIDDQIDQVIAYVRERKSL